MHVKPGDTSLHSLKSKNNWKPSTFTIKYVYMYSSKKQD